MSTENLQKFIEQSESGDIHQLEEWGKFQTSIKSGRDKYWVLTENDGHGKVVASAMVISQNLPFGLCWLNCPRGPVFSDPKFLPLIFEKISALAKQEKAVFCRFDFPIEQEKIPSEINKKLKQLQSVPAHAHYQPESTVIVDLQPSENEILGQMKPKGRYNIKLAQKHGVTVRKTPDVETFYKLFQQTTTRDKFSGHRIEYYKNMLKILGPKMAKLYVAEYSPPDKPDIKIPLAAAIVTYLKDTATYYFGASSNEYRNVMAPYLLHWQIMNDAKAAGYKYYDFFGIAPQDPTNVVRQQALSANHPWAKLTDFKLKFGGRIINYLPEQEIVYKPFWYALMIFAKTFRP